MKYKNIKLAVIFALLLIMENINFINASEKDLEKKETGSSQLEKKLPASSELILEPRKKNSLPSEEDFSFSPAINIPISLSPHSSLPPQNYWGINQSCVDYLFSHSPDLVALIKNNIAEDIKIKCFFQKINKQVWKETLGWKEEEIIGLPFISFMHPEDLKKAGLENKEEGKGSTETTSYQLSCGFETRFRCKNGSYQQFQWLIMGELDDSLEPEEKRFLYIGKDMTLARRKEEEKIKSLNKSKEKVMNLHRNLEYKNKVLQSVIDIQKYYINRDESETFFIEEYKLSQNKYIEIIIDHFIKITGSEFGFILNVFYNQENKKSFREVFSGKNKDIIKEHLAGHTLQCLEILLEKESGNKDNQCSFHDKIVNHIHSTRKRIIYNDIKDALELGETINIPKKHFPVSSFLAIPLIMKDELVGIVSLANRKEGYDDELLALLEPLSLLSVCILDDLNMEEWRREAERQRIARQNADAANQAKTAFLAHMSHEIRTPLTGILGLLELIDKTPLSEEDQRHMEIARISSLSLMSILNDILDISKIEAGQIALENIDLDPIKLIREIVDLLSMEAKKKDTKLALIINPSVPHELMGDPIRLRQIFMNLIGNAVKFTDNGLITVELGGQFCSPSEMKFIMECTVTDTGIGIREETMPFLFRPFSQADHSLMRQFGGTGLGLYITKELCTLMGGKIDVQSTFGKGTNFHFTVNMSVPDKHSSEKTSSSFQNRENLSGIRVLVAEDNSVSQIVLKRFIEKEGGIVTIVANGQEALETFQKEHYDVILMDGEMPVMDGLEATRQIRQQDRGSFIPIIGVTAQALGTDKERFIGAGMNGYLTKPVRIEAIKSEILRCLREKE